MHIKKYKKDCPVCDETNITTKIPYRYIRCAYCGFKINKNGFAVHNYFDDKNFVELTDNEIIDRIETDLEYDSGMLLR